MQMDKDLELVRRVAERQNHGGTAEPYDAPAAPRPSFPVAIVQCPCGNKLGIAERMGVNNTTCVCKRVYTMQRLGERL